LSRAVIRELRRWWRSQSEAPFLRLVRLFLGRILHSNGDSDDGELSFSAGLMLALLPLPGGFYAVFLFEKYSTLRLWMRGERLTDPLAATLPEEYFFIVLSMVVTGVLAVWRWESIFPDRRDYQNLVPLPLATAQIFLANMAAVSLLALVVGVDVNLGSALLFPLAIGAAVNSFAFFAHFIGVHILVVVLASLFSFFAVFVTIGLVMTVLPYRAFRWTSLYLRSVMIGSLVAVLATSFAVPAGLRHLSQSMVKLLPPVWFLGLCQWIRNGSGSQLATLGRVAAVASAIVLLGAVIAYALSYRRCFVRIPENIDVGPTTVGGPKLYRFSRLLDHVLLTSPLERAGYRFAIRTLLRSEQHALVLAGFLGLGTVIGSQFLFAAFNNNSAAVDKWPSPELLAVPLILSYSIIVGLRLALDLPSDTRSNWIFRFCVDKTTHGCAPLALKIILSFVLPWAIFLVLPIYGFLWGWWVGLLHTFILTAWSVLLAQILLIRFRKIPFTCPYPPFRDSAVVLGISYFLGFFVYVIMTAQLEYWALLSPMVGFCLILILAGSWYVLSRLREDIPDIDREVTFDESVAASFELLDLGRGS
jgi:hypothetical protein